MKIAMIVSERPAAEQRLAQALRERGHQVTAFQPGRPGKEDAPHTVRYRRLHTMRYPFTGAGGELRRLDDFDLIHVHGLDTVCLIALRRSVRRTMPVVLSDDGRRQKGEGLSVRRRREINNCDLLFAPTTAVRELLEAGGVTTPVRVFPAGVTPEMFRPDIALALQLRARWLAGRHRLFCCAARREEDARFLLQAATWFKRGRGDDFRLLFLGEQPCREELETQARLLGVGENVCFAGRAPDNVRSSWYRAGDLFLSANLHGVDSLPEMEAMAAGIPVLAADTGAVSHIVEEGRNGWTAGRDPQAFSILMERVEQTRLLREMGASAAQTACQYTVHSAAEAAEQHYRALLDVQRRAAGDRTVQRGDLWRQGIHKWGQTW